MFINYKYKVGLRVVKTAIAVFVCLLFSVLIQNTDFMHVAAVTAIITLRTSHKDTLRAGLLRVAGTLIGGILGILCAFFGGMIPNYAQLWFIIIVPVMMLIDFYICNVFNLRDAASVSSVVVLLVATSFGEKESVVSVAALRVIETLIGVIVATVVNLLIPSRHPLSENEASAKMEEEEEKGNSRERERK